MIEDAIKALFDFSMNNVNNEHQELIIGTVDEILAEKIRIDTGVDLSGFIISLNCYSISHTMKKHGSVIKENNRGQEAINIADFQSIMNIISDYDTIDYEQTQLRGASDIIETLIFKKDSESDCHYVVEEIKRVKKKGKTNQLVLKTMYIKRKSRTV
jgi:hypothetical protein